MARRSKNRGVGEVNAGSMADIAFLLLIFFLVTTTIQSDKGLALLLPPKPDEDTPPPDIDKNARNIFKVLVNSRDEILVEDEPMAEADIPEIREMLKEFVLNFGAPDDEARVTMASLPQSLSSMAKRDPNSSDNPKEAVVSFKADRGTSYDVYIKILDELQGAYYEIYGERVGMSATDFRNLDRKVEKQKQQYEEAREGIPMNISIAEPSKIGGG